MESEKIRKVAATNESADNNVEGAADYGEPSNIQSEDDQHLRSLLTSLNKAQLVHILVVLGMKIPQIAEGIRGAARPAASHRKLIVHEIGKETTSETLGKAFSNAYGEVEDANVPVDRTTGKSRGFGFITFKTLESVKKALEKQKTWVDGRLARQEPPAEAEIDLVDADPRKLFVARISSDVTSEMFLRFFEKYGEIEKGYLLYDKDTTTSKGLGFVTFKTVDAAKAAISDPDKNLGGNRISVEIRRFRKKKIEVQEESVITSYSPHVRNSHPNAINPPQRYGLQPQVPHPHFISGHEPYGIPTGTYQPPTGTYQPYSISGHEPYGIPTGTYQPPTGTYQPYSISGYEPYGIPTGTYQSPNGAYQPYSISGYEPYGIPTGTYQPYSISGYEPYGIPTGTYQPPTGAYQPYFISGYEPYGIPVAYQSPPVAYLPPTGTYQPHFSGYQPYGIPLPIAYQSPTEAYQAHFIGYEPYGMAPAYQSPTVAYQLPTGAYQPPTGFMFHPNYFAYQ